MIEVHDSITFFAICLLVLVGPVIVIIVLAPLAYDCRFHDGQIDVVILGGTITIWKIRNITSVAAVNLLNPLDVLSNFTFWGVRLYNRPKLKILVVYTSGLFPANVDAAIRALGPDIHKA